MNPSLDGVEIEPLRQEHSYTCVPACLRMVLRHLGREWPERELAARCRTTVIGTPVAGLTAALEALECDYEPLRHASLNDLIEYLAGDYAPIAFLRMDVLDRGLIGRHAVVVCSVDEVDVRFADPRTGGMDSLGCSDFERAWKAHRSEGMVVLSGGQPRR